MNLFPELEKVYGREQLSAGQAQKQAEMIAHGPIVFQISRIMLKWGIFEMLRFSNNGLTLDEIVDKTGKSNYAIKILLEASLSIGTVLINTETDRYTLSKTGWFLLNDRRNLIDIDFNHDVNYIGMFDLETALNEGRPAGLKHFGEWPTIYEALSSLPPQVQKSWFGFDHFYSDQSFAQALEVVFGSKTRTLLDVGGNTGRWALQCVAHDKDVNVTIMDLPQQLEMMRQNISGKEGAERIDGYAANLLDENTVFPTNKHYDAIWMSQFLDCFSKEQIISILKRAAKIMDEGTQLYIMETFWDRQRYETAAFCLTMTSVYFTAMANGNSKMYHSDDMADAIRQAGLKVEKIVDNNGLGHSIVICKK